MKHEHHDMIVAWVADTSRTVHDAITAARAYLAAPEQSNRYADPFTYVIQHLNSNPYNMTKHECVEHIKKLRDIYNGVQHLSDCAVHNEPAYPAGDCDCGAAPEQSEPDTRCKVKLGSQYGSDLAGHWFYLRPADKYAEVAMAKHSGITHPAPQPKAEKSEPVKATVPLKKHFPQCVRCNIAYVHDMADDCGWACDGKNLFSEIKAP